jgi:hypothetical protein
MIRNQMRSLTTAVRKRIGAKAEEKSRRLPVSYDVESCEER